LLTKIKIGSNSNFSAHSALFVIFTKNTSLISRLASNFTKTFSRISSTKTGWERCSSFHFLRLDWTS